MNDLSSAIVITPRHRSHMHDDVLARAPEEACGLLAGRGNHAQLVIPITNILHDPYRFRMDPHEELDAFQLADKQGLEIIAIYHSHPGGIYQPSPTDLAELTFPGIVYLIWYQEMGDWQCRAYFMPSESGAFEIPLVISTNS